MSAVNVLLKDNLNNDAYPFTVPENIIGIDQKIFDTAYPVGSIFISVTTTSSPAELGLSSGIWERIQGRFLIASGSNGDGATYTLGNTGGNKNAIVVSHTHNWVAKYTTESSGVSIGKDYGPNAGGAHICGQINNAGDFTNKFGYNSSTGESGTDKNMPPYQVVSMWRKVGNSINNESEVELY